MNLSEQKISGFRKLMACCVLLCCARIADADSNSMLRIAAASDLRFAMEEIVKAFEHEAPKAKIEVIYGSSGRFRTQIEHGAPFDMYFSADARYPEQLVQAGHALSVPVPYAVGRVVVWGKDVDARTLHLDKLDSYAFKRIAIANPRHAPYGARAKEALEALQLWDRLEPTLVYGENIAHTLQLVESGAAEIGIVALSLVLSPTLAGGERYQLIEEHLHQALNQAFIVTKRAQDKALAWRFAAYLQTAPVRSILQNYGFVLPEITQE